jgi:hypothetical protein
MNAPGRLEVASTGHVTGPASLTYNDPFPCLNGSFGSGAMTGVLEHTMVGDLPGTIAWFNNPQARASAHFGVDQQRSIHQFGPIGKGWVAWNAAEANQSWYGIEFADDGNPQNPLTAAQFTASASEGAQVSIGRTVEAKAQDGTVTLEELRAFIGELDQAGAAESTPVKAPVRFGGGIKSLKATAVRLGDQEGSR